MYKTGISLPSVPTPGQMIYVELIGKFCLTGAIVEWSAAGLHLSDIEGSGQAARRRFIPWTVILYVEWAEKEEEHER